MLTKQERVAPSLPNSSEAFSATELKSFSLQIVTLPLRIWVLNTFTALIPCLVRDGDKTFQIGNRKAYKPLPRSPFSRRAGTLKSEYVFSTIFVTMYRFMNDDWK